jgi:PhnB protein
MSKRSLANQLDDVVQAMLTLLQPRPEEKRHSDLAALVRVAQVLRELPREEFRAALKTELHRRTAMNKGTGQAPASEAPSDAVPYIRPGLTSVTPYVVTYRAAEFLQFLKDAFGGVERLSVPAQDGSIVHAEVQIGNGTIELADANQQFPSSPTDIHLYVDDADATFAHALEAGATSIFSPTDEHPSGDRWGAIKDPFGNNWYIATPRGWTPGPEGIRSVQPYLHLRGADKMIPFMEAAFGAEPLGVHKSPEGRVLHATVRIGNATLEMDEAHGEFQPKSCHLHVYVPDADTIYERALHAGATSIEIPQTKPYGDRSAGVKDPFGNTWFIATYIGVK